MTDSTFPQRIPVDLVTGFLGSGKTTLINAVLRDAAFAGTLVIVNEFGEVGLDHLLVSSAEDNVVLLDSGCLCCAVSGTLRDTLIDLFSRRASGTVPAFDRIIVETSGLANPAPVVAALLGDSALKPRCALAQVLTLVDAANGLHTLQHYREAQRQVAFADRLVISKTDTASLEQVDALAAALADLNPNAPVARRQRGDASALHFAPLAAPLQAAVVPAPAWLRGPLQPQYGGTVTHSGAFQRISTHLLQVAQPLSWAAYAAWTETLRRRFGKQLLRCKGLLRMEPDGSPWVIQGVQGFFAPPQRLDQGVRTDTLGFLVCIGEDLARTELEAASRPFISEPEPHEQ